MSELFAKLYAQAVKREWAQLHLAWVLWAELELDDAPRCGRMARGLLALHEDFETELMEVATLRRMRIDRRRRNLLKIPAELAGNAPLLLQYLLKHFLHLLKDGG